VAAQRAKNAKGKAIKRELKSIESKAINGGLLPRDWNKTFKFGL
jgi:hypothetical protein